MALAQQQVRQAVHGLRQCQRNRPIKNRRGGLWQWSSGLGSRWLTQRKAQHTLARPPTDAPPRPAPSITQDALCCCCVAFAALVLYLRCTWLSR